MRDKKNLHKEEVKSFSENILEKIYKSYEKKFQVSLRKPAKIPVRPMKQNLNKKEKYIFIKKLKDLCKLISNLNCIPIRKKTNTDGTLGYEFYRSAYKNKLRYKDIVENKNFPWKLLSIGGHANAKKLFHSVLKDEETYNRLILKRKTAHLEKGNEDNNLYCYCKAKYEGSDFMICKNIPNRI